MSARVSAKPAFSKRQSPGSVATPSTPGCSGTAAPSAAATQPSVRPRVKMKTSQVSNIRLTAARWRPRSASNEARSGKPPAWMRGRKGSAKPPPGSAQARACGRNIP